MKSILQEASSVERAVDKAWNEAGKPKEFTIKILDQGERNFFGLMRRPAVVSILYKPEKSTYQQPRSRGRSTVNNGVERAPRGRQPNSSTGRSSHNRRADNADRSRERSSQRNEEMNGWRDEWKQNVTGNIRQLLKLMNIKVSFNAQANEDKVLTVTFKQAVLHDEEEQRMLFASLSYLSIQFLKREYKNRFTGFRIVVTGPTPKKRVEKTEKAEEPVKEASKEKKSTGRTERSSARSSKSRSNSSASAGKKTRGQNDDHLLEQLKFAQQQLEQEEEVKQVFENAIRQAEGKNDAPAEEKPAPAVVEQKAEPTVEKKEAASAVSEKAPKKSAKKEKYQPFFVMPDDEENSGS